MAHRDRRGRENGRSFGTIYKPMSLHQAVVVVFDVEIVAAVVVATVAASVATKSCYDSTDADLLAGAYCPADLAAVEVTSRELQEAKRDYCVNGDGSRSE